MPTYDVTIRMLVTKTYRVAAASEVDATEEAHEHASVLYEDGVAEGYDQETISATLVVEEDN